MQDNDIISLYWERNEAAITETEKKYGGYCFSIARNILTREEDAEETVSDTWLKTWNSIPPTRPSYLRLFVGRITRNLSISRLRKTKQYNEEVSLILNELQECVGGTASAEDEAILNEFTAEIVRVIHQLPKRERCIFLRRYYYADSIPDIAKRYRLRNENVYVILGRTRKRIREQLEFSGWI